MIQIKAMDRHENSSHAQRSELPAMEAHNTNVILEKLDIYNKQARIRDMIHVHLDILKMVQTVINVLRLVKRVVEQIRRTEIPVRTRMPLVIILESDYATMDFSIPTLPQM